MKRNKIFAKIKPILPALILIAVGSVMMLYGIERGEIAVMLKKAVRICLECIGIG